MPSIKSVSLGLTLATGVIGVGSAVAYSKGAFNPAKVENISEEKANNTTSIRELLEEENKYSLLAATSLNEGAAWNAAWEQYIENASDKWKIPNEEGLMPDQAPQSFKEICQQKATEQINGREDPRYSDITNYCSRPKTLKEVFEKDGINMLDTSGQDNKWKTKFEKYKVSDKQIPGATQATNSDGEEQFIKLRDGCKNALELKSTIDNYQSTYDAVKEWCKEEA